MELLVCVINQEEKLDDILSGLLELGITGATVIDTAGMGHVLRRDVPIFAGLKELVSRARSQNHTIFSVVESREKLERAIALVQEVCGDLSEPSTGILFTLPIGRVVGLAPELGSNGA